ncbi:MAG TPA: M67 family metallopeptidase [Terriglobales bacterium]|nr:M67 family metallopeptidase [Terriglobales bacterium]
MLKLPAALAAELRAQGQRAYPEECCGVLLGRARGDTREVVEARACANARAGTRDRYAIAPGELIAAQRAARERGLELLGFYHSHPDHPPEPSATDRVEAYWEGSSYVIVSVTRGQADDLRSFVLRGGRFEAESVTP